MWKFSGEKVNADGKLINCAKREVMEEPGLIPQKLEYKGYTERIRLKGKLNCLGIEWLYWLERNDIYL